MPAWRSACCVSPSGWRRWWRSAAAAARWCCAPPVETPAQAVALAAWLSSHGDLLAELQLELGTDSPDWPAASTQAQRRHQQHRHQQHPPVRVLEQMPGNLTRLAISGAEVHQAAAFVAVLSRQPMQQLRHLALPRSWRDHAAALLPALAALGQLTSLVMWTHDLSQLPAQHLQQLPVQLQQLELHASGRCSAAALPWLALPHLTGLTSLSVPSMRVDGGALPRGLHELTVVDVSTAAPLQRLAQLTALQLRSCAASAEQLRQLSTLQRLEQLSVRMAEAEDDALSNAAPAFGALPLVQLFSCHQELTAACLDHLGACTRLTHLELYSCSLAPRVTPEQLAAMLGRLTALERVRNWFVNAKPADTDADWAPVCQQALARLPRLTACDLSGAKVGPAAAAHLAAAAQLTELRVAGCGLDDASMSALCSGLTGLCRLDVSYNRPLGDGCLECIAALRQLSWLRMRDMKVTEGGLQQLQAARPDLQLEV